MLELQDVSRRYLLGGVEVHALRGITLKIEAGEYLAIMGQSGSGKSTLMNLLGCLDTPSSGTYWVAGQATDELSSDQLASLRRERFGFIFQRYNLLPAIDARANTALPAVYSGMTQTARVQRADALLARLGLQERVHHKPNELSGGQQQRVSIARALMNGGQIVLADEPTGALDSKSGMEMLALFEELNRQGHTIILVTHDAQVAAHAKRIIELHDGQLVRDTGTPAHHPALAILDAQQDGGVVASSTGWRRHQNQWREALKSAAVSLASNRLRTVLSMLGISIGIAAVVSILALTAAARYSIEKNVTGLLAGRIHVWSDGAKLRPGAKPQAFRPHEIEAIRALPGIKSVVVNQSLSLTVSHAFRETTATVKGQDAYSRASQSIQIVEGRGLTDFDFSNKSQVALINQSARKSLFKAGAPVIGQTLLITLKSSAPDGISKSRSDNRMDAVAVPMTIVGIVEPDPDGPEDYSDAQSTVTVPFTTLTSKLDSRLESSSFEVLLDLSVPPDQVRDTIHTRLKALHRVEDFRIWNAQEEFKKFQEVLVVMSLVFAGVGAISLLVGGVGVMNMMLVSVNERTREIGIRMAVGARQSDIRLQFLIESVVLCCLGGAVGVALGSLGASAVNEFQKELTVRMDFTSLSVAFGVSTLIGLLFGTLPARRAAALKPVDALARE